MSALEELLALMRRLRAVDGCPWDRAQTFTSIAPYTIEEAYEVADAIERNDMPHLRDELGDLLLQVVFHSELAREAGHFDFADVTTAIIEKLVRRHPHVFAAAADDNAAGHHMLEQQMASWEDIKARERADARAATPAVASQTESPGDAASALDGVPVALPALMRAVKLSKRAARVGFDFDHPSATADKVAEELAEVREAAAAGDGNSVSPHLFEEVGDLLFAVANLARKLDVDAEAALRAANGKFQRRFRDMERLAAERGLKFDSLGLRFQEALWQEVKRAE